ncbi:Protein POLLENLESS 3 [Sarracenia purpurea var. burkii]
MLTTNMNSQSRGLARPPLPPLSRKSRRWSPRSQGRPPSVKRGSPPPGKANLFHVIHKVPAGDSPYGRAKHVQLIEKDPNRAIPLFWAAIYAGDRVDSALKDMAVVMKQLNRSDEAIKAIKSFRHLCLLESQESLDNILVELYKKSGCTEELIEVLRHKLKNIEEGIAFGGEKTKSARSQGRKVQITIAQEYSRLLGNLAWAYMKQNNFKSAEEFYRNALSIEQDKNKQCNLAICLMHMNRVKEAKLLLQSIRVSPIDARSNDTYVKSF